MKTGLNQIMVKNYFNQNSVGKQPCTPLEISRLLELVLSFMVRICNFIFCNAHNGRISGVLPQDVAKLN